MVNQQVDDRLTHDDMVDALAYIDQLAFEFPMGSGFENDVDWEVLDEMSGW